MIQQPTPTQAAFLLVESREALFGGAAGGGKSSALLLAALQYVDVPGYSALLLRRTYADLAKPGALMDRATAWLGGTDAEWNEQKKFWRFPSGAVLSFGHLEHDRDRFAYQGAEYQFIGFDELTQFSTVQYRYMFSRTRRLEGSNVPIRVRAASNPGGSGHAWVYQRFFVERSPKRVFIPSKLEDNPHLDRAEYEEALNELDPVTRRQLRHGDWEARAAGNFFDRRNFEIIDRASVPTGVLKVRCWDFAATEAAPGIDPDWTVGVLLGRMGGTVYVLDVVRVQADPDGVERTVATTARLDGVDVQIRMEQEPGSAGKGQVSHYARNVVPGFAVKGKRATGDKVLRARPVSAAVANKRVKLVRAKWNSDFLDELEAFPLEGHDDQVDALSGAFDELHAGGNDELSSRPTTATRRSKWFGAM